MSQQDKEYRVVIRDENNNEFEIPPDIAAWVKTNRERLNKSLQQVADAVDVTRQAVFFWESGRTKPTMDKMSKLVAYFKSCDDVQGQSA